MLHGRLRRYSPMESPATLTPLDDGDAAVVGMARSVGRRHDRRDRSSELHVAPHHQQSALDRLSALIVKNALYRLSALYRQSALYRRAL